MPQGLFNSMKGKIAALQDYIRCLTLRLREYMDAAVPFICCSSHLPPKTNALGQSRVLLVPLACLDKPVAVLLSGSSVVAELGMPALNWHVFVSNSPPEPTSGCYWPLWSSKYCESRNPLINPSSSGIRKLLLWALAKHSLWLGCGGVPSPSGNARAPLILGYQFAHIGPVALWSQTKFPLLLLSDAKASPWGRWNSSCLILWGARQGAQRDSAWKGELKGNRTLACRHDTQWVTGSVKFAHSAS